MPLLHRADGTDTWAADKAITDAIDAHVDDERNQDDDGDDGLAGVLIPALPASAVTASI